jgi:predicted nuclease of predicted toxin-antitoxin system
VALNLYLDDCILSHRITDLLRQAGHEVVRSSDVGLEGADDDVHFRYAADNGLILITKNPKDFKILHDSDPLHFGIFAIYQDNDGRDMSDAEIVRAIRNLEDAAHRDSFPIHGGFYSINDWRY